MPTRDEFVALWPPELVLRSIVWLPRSWRGSMAWSPGLSCVTLDSVATPSITGYDKAGCMSYTEASTRWGIDAW